MIQGNVFLQNNIYNCPLTERYLQYAKLFSEKNKQEEKEKKKGKEKRNITREQATYKPLAFCQREGIKLASRN